MSSSWLKDAVGVSGGGGESMCLIHEFHLPPPSRDFLKALGFMTYPPDSFPVPSQPACEVLTLSSTILEADTQAQSGRGLSQGHTALQGAELRLGPGASQISDCWSSGRCGLQWDSVLQTLVLFPTTTGVPNRDLMPDHLGGPDVIIKCTAIVAHLNHPETIPDPQSMEKKTVFYKT